MTFIGLSGYPTSYSNINQIIQKMTYYGMNTYRMSANPEWFSSKPHPYRPEYIQYFLDNSNFNIIVDRNHIYPPTEDGAQTFRNNISTALNSLLEVCESWPNNQRIMVELSNEYVSSDFRTIHQYLMDEIRNSGYTNPLVANKWETGWASSKLTDPLNNYFMGMHFYFNSWSVNSAIQQMQYAINNGIRCINTEIGADYREARYFTSATVEEVNQFLELCEDLDVGNTIWMNENLDNMPKYEELGLRIPVVSLKDMKVSLYVS